MYTSTGGSDVFFMRGTAYQIEVHHQPTPESMLVGGALELGPDQPTRHYFGLAGVVGSSWRRRSWFVEGTLGLGIEVLDAMRKQVTVTNSTADVGTVAETTVSLSPTPGFYFRLGGIAGVQLSTAFDLVAQLGAHLSSTGDVGSFLSATAGVRLRLP
jgi:hypothetical protein